MIERVVKVTNVSQFNVVLWAIISKQFLSEQWDIGNLESELNTASLRMKKWWCTGINLFIEDDSTYSKSTLYECPYGLLTPSHHTIYL